MTISEMKQEFAALTDAFSKLQEKIEMYVNGGHGPTGGVIKEPVFEAKPVVEIKPVLTKEHVNKVIDSKKTTDTGV